MVFIMSYAEKPPWLSGAFVSGSRYKSGCVFGEFDINF